MLDPRRPVTGLVDVPERVLHYGVVVRALALRAFDGASDCCAVDMVAVLVLLFNFLSNKICC